MVTFISEEKKGPSFVRPEGYKPPEKPYTTLDQAEQMARAGADVMAKFAGGAAGFMAGGGAQIASSLMQSIEPSMTPEVLKSLPEYYQKPLPQLYSQKEIKREAPKTPEEIARENKLLVAAISSIFVDTPHPTDPEKVSPGMIYGTGPESLIKSFVEPGTKGEEYSQNIMGAAEKAIEFVTTPAKKLGEVVGEAGSPNIGEAVKFFGELATFKGLHQGTSKVAKTGKSLYDFKKDFDWFNRDKELARQNLESKHAGMAKEVLNELPTKDQIVTEIPDVDTTPFTEQIKGVKELADLNKPVEITPELQVLAADIIKEYEKPINDLAEAGTINAETHGTGVDLLSLANKIKEGNELTVNEFNTMKGLLESPDTWRPEFKSEVKPVVEEPVVEIKSEPVDTKPAKKPKEVIEEKLLEPDEVDWDVLPEWVEPELEVIAETPGAQQSWANRMLTGEYSEVDVSTMNKWLKKRSKEIEKEAEEVAKVTRAKIEEEEFITKREFEEEPTEVPTVDDLITKAEPSILVGPNEISVAKLQEHYPNTFNYLTNQFPEISKQLVQNKDLVIGVENIETLYSRAYRSVPFTTEALNEIIQTSKELERIRLKTKSSKIIDKHNTLQSLEEAKNNKTINKREYKILKKFLGDLKSEPDFKILFENERSVGGSFDSLKNVIKSTPASFTHEVAHWAFDHILSSADRIEFMESMKKFYSEEGVYDPKLLEKYTAIKSGEVNFRGIDYTLKTNSTSSFQEFFAEQFRNYVHSDYFNRVENKTIFKKVVHAMRTLYRNLRNKDYIDPSLQKYMKKILDFDKAQERKANRVKKAVEKNDPKILSDADVIDYIAQRMRKLRDKDLKKELEPEEFGVEDFLGKEDVYERPEFEQEVYREGDYGEEFYDFDQGFHELKFSKESLTPEEKIELKKEILKEATSNKALDKMKRKILAERKRQATINENKTLTENAKELELPEDVKTDLRTISDRSFDEGKPVTQLLEERGYTPEKAVEVDYLIKLLNRKDKLDKGEVVNSPGYRKYKTGDIEWTVEKPYVYKPELETIKNIKDIKKTPKGVLTDSLMIPDTLFRKLDPRGREVRKLFQDPLRDAQHNTVLKQKVQQAVNKGIKKMVKRSRGKNFAGHLINMQRHGAKILEAMNMKLEPLTKNELDAMRVIHGELEKLWFQLNKSRTENGLKPLNKVSNYFTFFRDMEMLDRFGIGNSSDFYNMKFPDKVKDPNFRFSKKRGELLDQDGNVVPISLNWGKVLDNYTNNAIRHIEITPAIMKAKELLKAFKEPKVKGEKQKFWSLKDSAPNADAYLNRWLNATSMNRAESIGNKWLDDVSYNISNNLTAALLAYSVRLVAIQPTAIAHTYWKLNEVSFARGLTKTLNPNEFSRARRESKVLLARDFDANAADFANIIYNEKGWNKLKTTKEGLAKAGLVIARLADGVTATSSWLMAEDFALRKGKSPAEAKRFADQIVVETQGSGAIMDRAPIQLTNVGKLLTTFQTYNIAQFNTIWHNTIKDFKTANNKQQRAAQLARMAVSMALINYIYEDFAGMSSPMPTPLKAGQQEWERLEKREKQLHNKSSDASKLAWSTVAGGKELLSLYPYLASIAYGKGATPAFLDSVNKVFEAKDYKSMVKALAVVTGLPGTGEVVKIKRGVESDMNLWNIIAGGLPENYKRKREKRKKGKFD